MTKIKLTYFDFDGGRAEPIRLILNWGDIDFEDIRISYADFAEVRKKTPFGQVPVVEIDGQVVTQTDALIRYFAKQVGLFPQEEIKSLLSDEVMNVIEDATNKLVATFGLEGEALKTARQALAEGPLSMYLKWLEGKLQSHGGVFYTGDNICYADFKLYCWIKSLLAGHLDHIPTTLVEQHAPSALKHFKHMSQQDKIKAYYKNR